MTKLYFENDYKAPAELTEQQQRSFNACLLSKVSLYVAPEEWNRMRQDTLREVLGTGKGGVR